VRREIIAIDLLRVHIIDICTVPHCISQKRSETQLFVVADVPSLKFWSAYYLRSANRPVIRRAKQIISKGTVPSAGMSFSKCK
jgi:hypothetical protein